MCSTPNPVESVFCVKCGARLVPLTQPPASDKPPAPPPIKGLSLPSKSATEDKIPAQPESPATDAAPSDDWLAHLRASAPADEDQPATESAEIFSDRSAPAESETRAPKIKGVEDIPDWLNTSTQPQAEAAPEIAEEKEPTWVRQMRATMPAEETQTPLDEPDPTWIRQMRAAADQTETPPTPEEQTPSWIEQPRAPIQDREPSWLEQPGSVAPVAEQPRAPMPAEPIAPVEAEMPAWLAQLRATARAEESPSETISDQAPAWLQAAPTSAEPPVESSEPEIEKPDWLTSMMAEPAPATESAEQASEVPDWLRAALPPSAEPMMPITPQAPAETESPSEELIESLSALPSPFALAEPTISGEVEEEDIPEWLRTAKPAEKPEVSMGEAAPGIERGQVPEWIAALKPVETLEQWPSETMEGEPVETIGPLAGMRGVLPLANAIAEPHILSTRPAATPEKSGARIFESLLSAPAALAAPIATKRAPTFALGRLLVYLLLGLVVIAPFLLPLDWSSALLDISRTPTTELYDALNALPANSTVALAFEYDASNAGEMDLQARALARHLAQRGVRVIALSTYDTGPQIAQRVLEDATRGMDKYVYGVNYLNAGYLAGHEAGLAQFATTGFAAFARDGKQNQPLAQFPMMTNVKQLRDIALVVVVAGSDDALKMWMDQVQPRGVKIAAGVSAGGEPKARAYRTAQQLTALMSGLIGAAQYEILAGQPGLAVISVNAQSAAQLVFVFLIVIGNLVFWIGRARSKAK